MNMKLEGFRELERELERLANRNTRKASARRSVKKAAQPTLAMMRARAPRLSGGLAESIAISTRLAKRQSSMHRKMFRDDRAAIELFLGASYNIGDGGRHGHLQEFGTVHHGPQPFVRPAFDADHRAMLDRISKELWEDIQKAVARAERRAARQAVKG